LLGDFPDRGVYFIENMIPIASLKTWGQHLEQEFVEIEREK
jgi:hypothetical protein